MFPWPPNIWCKNCNPVPRNRTGTSLSYYSASGGSDMKLVCSILTDDRHGRGGDLNTHRGSTFVMASLVSFYGLFWFLKLTENRISSSQGKVLNIGSNQIHFIFQINQITQTPHTSKSIKWRHQLQLQFCSFKFTK